MENGKEYRESLEGLGEMMQKAEKDGVEGLGMWKEGGEIGWTDVMVGPCTSLPLIPYHSSSTQD